MKGLRKIVSLLVSAVAICSTLSGCTEYIPPVEPTVDEPVAELVKNPFPAPKEKEEPAVQIELKAYPVTVEGTIFGGSKEEAVHTQLHYGEDLLTLTDNTRYSAEVADFAGLLSADVYFRDKDLAKGTQNRVLLEEDDPESYDHTSLLRGLGFADAAYVETFKEKEYTEDTNDSATMLMGHQVVNDAYDVFVFVLRGCFSAQEWLSIYDPGASDEAYEKLTGEHPEWKTASQPKGISVAAVRAREFMDAFLEEYSDPSRQTVVLVTGHSRGAALANVIGAQLEEEGKVKSFTYTFNTPCVDTAARPGKHKTVFNIFESGDLFTDHLPFGSDVLYRNGTDVTAGDETKLAEAFETLTGRTMPECLSASENAEFRSLFGARFDTRASLYEPRTITETFETKEEADARYETCVRETGAEEGLDLGEYVTVEKPKKTAEGYELTIAYSDAAWLICYAKTLAYGKAAYSAAVDLFAQDTDGCKVADFLAEHGAEISAGHLLVRSWLIGKGTE